MIAQGRRCGMPHLTIDVILQGADDRSLTGYLFTPLKLAIKIVTLLLSMFRTCL